MTTSDNISAIDKTADRCKFSTYGYACGKHVEHGRYLCEEHATAKCASCGSAATHGCDFCGQFVCGTPLCDECTFGTDKSKPSGAWGFINHIHVSKPEFADKHENARLKAENAELTSKAEAMERALTGLLDAKALSGIRKLVAGWDGDHLPEEQRIGVRHRDELGVTLPTNCGAIYELDGVMTRARTLLNGGSDAQG